MRNKRKSYVIDRAFQYRLIGTFLISVVIAFILFSGGTILYFWASSVIEDELSGNRPNSDPPGGPISTNDGEKQSQSGNAQLAPEANRWEIIVPPILVNNFLIMIAVAVIGVFYSHRIIGPVYRINRDLQRVLDGEEDVRIKLRDKDQFKGLAGRVNTLLDAFYSMKSKSDVNR